MRVGYYAPLPPSPSGVADYAAALLDAMREEVSIAVNGPGDVALYHIGNNQLHRGIYERALSNPGVVILHDAVLHHFLLGALDEEAYVAEFRYNYGGWGEDAARRLWSTRSRSGADPEFFRYPMLRRLAERSLAIIVHNGGAASMVRAHSAEAKVRVVPHLYVPQPAPSSYAVARARASLGVPAHQFLYGIFGHLRESKRIAPVLRAFGEARRSADMRLLIAGDFVSNVYERALQPLLAAPGVIRRPHLADDQFLLHAAAVDACISLRYPSAGETSGITVRMMGMGKTVLVTDSAENDFPPETCVRVSAGIAEEEELAAEMVRLAERRDDVRAIGANAAAFIAREHNSAEAARAIVSVLRSCYDECSIPVNLP